MIRVLIVDDSRTIRIAVAEHLRAAGIQVVGEAVDGHQAVELTLQLRPDVVLMDVVMPGMGGLTATRRIMSEVPTPVVILSGHADEKEVLSTYDALAAGALEVCAKPLLSGPPGEAEWDRILLIIGAAAQVSVTRLRGYETPPIAGASIGRPVTACPRSQRKVILIGASTGGPVAVREILAALPADFSVPILVAIHCNRNLASSVAPWFDRDCALPVSDAQHEQLLPLGRGVVLTAPPGRNLTIRRGRMILKNADVGVVSPSIDKLFCSAADDLGSTTLGVLLTGMGADGAQGLERLKARGGHTIAQDEASCVVFGMPAAAIKLGAADHVTPLSRIPSLLTRLADSPSRNPPGVHS